MGRIQDLPERYSNPKGVENERNWAGALASKILMYRSATDFVRWVDIITQARNTFQHGITHSYSGGFFDKPHGTLCMNISGFWQMWHYQKRVFEKVFWTILKCLEEIRKYVPKIIQYCRKNVIYCEAQSVTLDNVAFVRILWCSCRVWK